MRISDWSSDVCSSDLQRLVAREASCKDASGIHGSDPLDHLPAKHAGWSDEQDYKHDDERKHVADRTAYNRIDIGHDQALDDAHDNAGKQNAADRFKDRQQRDRQRGKPNLGGQETDGFSAEEA